MLCNRELICTNFEDYLPQAPVHNVVHNVLTVVQILVPIHQDIHWCLAVINIRDKRFEYLDSLKGQDKNVLQVLVSSYYTLLHMFCLAKNTLN